MELFPEVGRMWWRTGVHQLMMQLRIDIDIQSNQVVQEADADDAGASVERMVVANNLLLVLPHGHEEHIVHVLEAEELPDFIALLFGCAV